MAWGSSSKAQPSTVSQVLPLLIVFAILGVGGWVGYQVYLSVGKISETASERMGKKNVVFTKDGLKVGVKEIRNENYVDATQSWVVKAWNLGTAKEDQQKRFGMLRNASERDACVKVNMSRFGERTTWTSNINGTIRVRLERIPLNDEYPH
ncbi:Fc.00g012660.m01.CDS01 [Cosmosporella sp. VM-42]